MLSEKNIIRAENNPSSRTLKDTFPFFGARPEACEGLIPPRPRAQAAERGWRAERAIRPSLYD